MPCGDAALATPFQDGMDGDQPILLEDADLAAVLCTSTGRRRVALGTL